MPSKPYELPPLVDKAINTAVTFALAEFDGESITRQVNAAALYLQEKCRLDLANNPPKGTKLAQDFFDLLGALESPENQNDLTTLKPPYDLLGKWRGVLKPREVSSLDGNPDLRRLPRAFGARTASLPDGRDGFRFWSRQDSRLAIGLISTSFSRLTPGCCLLPRIKHQVREEQRAQGRSPSRRIRPEIYKRTKKCSDFAMRSFCPRAVQPDLSAR
jgi:hypothetical protein